jgi:hypothetical protein
MIDKKTLIHAINNGFNPTKGILEDNMLEENAVVFYYVYQKGDLPRKHMIINIYHLIFDTSLGFIESLVGEGGIKWICSGCGAPYSEDARGKWCSAGCNPKTVPLVSRANCHRRELANLPLEEMKQYINRLCEEV